jgi:hypothetical protein
MPQPITININLTPPKTDSDGYFEPVVMVTLEQW